MSIMIGQISYLPNNELRTKRLTASHTQFEWFDYLLPNTKTMIVAQAYTSDELPDKNKYDVLAYDEPIGAGLARNKVLEYFYHSDYDWLLLCDDDTTAYDYYNYQDFIRDVAENPDKFDEIDAISAVEPEYYPYKKLNFQDKNNLTHYKFEPRVLNSGSATSLIRNIKKYYGVEIYYPNVDANKGEGREDIEFLIAWLQSGYTWYTMQTWIRKSLCFDQSSIFGGDTKVRDAILMHDLDVLCERYADVGITRNVHNKITWAEFNKRYNRCFKVKYIQRRTPIEYTEKETPKEKPIANALF